MLSHILSRNMSKHLHDNLYFAGSSDSYHNCLSQWNVTWKYLFFIRLHVQFNRSSWYCSWTGFCYCLLYSAISSTHLRKRYVQFFPLQNNYMTLVWQVLITSFSWINIFGHQKYRNHSSTCWNTVLSKQLCLNPPDWRFYAREFGIICIVPSEHIYSVWTTLNVWSLLRGIN